VIQFLGAKIVIMVDEPHNSSSVEYQEDGFRQTVLKIGKKISVTTDLDQGRYKSVVDLDGDGIPDRAILRSNGQVVNLRTEERP